MSDFDYTAASDVIRRGGVIAYPTEAVWGFGCDPWNESAVDKVLQLKQRPVGKGLIVVAAALEQISPLLAPLPQHLQARLKTPTLRATTWLIPDECEWIPAYVKGMYKTIAVRISQHPVVRGLCQAVGQPVISTSANLAGEPALLEYVDVVSRFEEKLDMIILGETGDASSPSTIIDLITGTVIR